MSQSTMVRECTIDTNRDHLQMLLAALEREAPRRGLRTSRVLRPTGHSVNYNGTGIINATSEEQLQLTMGGRVVAVVLGEMSRQYNQFGGGLLGSATRLRVHIFEPAVVEDWLRLLMSRYVSRYTFDAGMFLGWRVAVGEYYAPRCETMR